MAESGFEAGLVSGMAMGTASSPPLCVHVYQGLQTPVPGRSGTWVKSASGRLDMSDTENIH